MDIHKSYKEENILIGYKDRVKAGFGKREVDEEIQSYVTMN